MSQPGSQGQQVEEVSEMTLNRRDFPIKNRAGDARPYIEVKIKNRRISGLLDSGAQISLISSKFFQSLRSLHLRVCPVAQQSIQTADGTCHPINKAVELPILVDGEVKMFQVLLAPVLNQPLIFGVDFFDCF